MKMLSNTFFIGFFFWALIAGADRLYWVNSGSGLAGWVGASVLQEVGIDDCGDEGAELKYDDDRLEYRCGNIAIWPMYLGRSGHSPKIQAYWYNLQAKMRASKKSDKLATPSTSAAIPSSSEME